MVCRRLLPAFAATAVLAAGSAALAQGQVSTAGAVGAALGAPAQPRVARQLPEATVAPSTAGGLAALTEDQMLAIAIAANDIAGIIAHGGTAPQVAAAMYRPPYTSGRVSLDIADARFVRMGDGLGVLVPRNNGQAQPQVFGVGQFFGGAFPGGLEGLPSYDATTPAPYVAPITQILIAGGNPQDAAMVFITGEGVGAPADALTARFVQGPSGGVALAIRTTPDFPPTLISIPGSESFPGLASLPTSIQAFPVPPLQSFKPLPEIPASWITTPAAPSLR